MSELGSRLVIIASHQSLCDIQFTPLPLPPIQAAAVGAGEGGEGADSTSYILGKHELKGLSRQYVFVCLCECVNTIETKLQPEISLRKEKYR